MNISGRRIAPDQPPYIIAELGVNHDGSLDRCLELTDASAQAGADAIKLQYFEAERLMSRASRLAGYQKAAGEKDPVAMLARLQLTIEQMARVVERAHARGIHAIVTVFSVELVDPANTLPWDAYKTASPDLVNKPLLDALLTTGKPLIISTGAATLDEVRTAHTWLTPAHDRLALLQCVSSYPTPIADSAVRAIDDLRRVHPLVGYSDHTRETDTGMYAARAGAVILEKHVTYSRGAQGPDHAASLEPDQLAEYIRLARKAHAAGPRMGPMEDPRLEPVRKQVLAIEQDVRTVSRQSVVTTRALRAGERLTRADLTIKRPGTGIPAMHLDQVIGLPTLRPVEGNVPLQWADLER